jgi:putative transposase
VLTAWRRERETWLAAHPPPHDDATTRVYHEKFTRRFHRYLDEGHGACPFRHPDLRALLIETMMQRDGVDHALDAFVVMPNHVHALVCPQGERELSQISKAWKRVSAHLVNRYLGRKGALWQEESWDHIVRAPEHLDRFRRYIEANPGRLRRG